MAQGREPRDGSDMMDGARVPTPGVPGDGHLAACEASRPRPASPPARGQGQRGPSAEDPGADQRLHRRPGPTHLPPGHAGWGEGRVEGGAVWSDPRPRRWAVPLRFSLAGGRGWGPCPAPGVAGKAGLGVLAHHGWEGTWVLLETRPRTTEELRGEACTLSKPGPGERGSQERRLQPAGWASPASVVSGLRGRPAGPEGDLPPPACFPS